MNNDLLEKYAKLTVKIGANVQPGQPVIIHAQVDQQEFVKLLVQQAYQAGAAWVRVEWNYQALTLEHVKYQSPETLATVFNWQKAMMKDYIKFLPAVIHVLSEDPDGLKDVDIAKMQAAQQKRRKALKRYNDALDNKHQWTIVAVPSPAWAGKVFPGESSDAAIEKLWEAIFKSVRINADNDPVAEWNEHNANFKALCQKLNSFGLKSLHYKNSLGTDFSVGLIPQALWMGGGDTTLSGTYFNPNMPTEEIFTAPMRGIAEGRLVASMPLSYQGQLIENFYIDFKKGKAVNWDATSGKELLTMIINADKYSGYLGELALVPHDSPISNQKLLFYETLFDENASCHVALGSGYTSCIKDFQNYTLKEITKMGVNDSIVHVDFMIGTADMCITGLMHNGDEIEIFTNGNWAF